MKPEDRTRVVGVIKAHARRLALGELAARGTSHVRVITGEKALELIEAVVDDTIARRAGELAEVDRDRIVQEAQERFQQVAKLQAQAEDLALRQSEKIKELKERDTQLVKALRRRERRLANTRETIQNYDHEIERLATQVEVDARLIDDLQKSLRERTGELKQLQEVLKNLSEGAHAGESETLSRLQGELAQMKDALLALDERGTSTAGRLEDRFEATMSRTLDRIRQTLHAATARPFDRAREATDILVSKIFDGEEDMDTNLSRLDVEVTTAREGIAKSLERLKRLRASTDPGEDEEEAAPPPA